MIHDPMMHDDFAYILENLSTVCLITHKINFQNFKPLFPVILRIFDLECHGQAPLKIAFVKFGKTEKPPPGKQKTRLP